MLNQDRMLLSFLLTMKRSFSRGLSRIRYPGRMSLRLIMICAGIGRRSKREIQMLNELLTNTFLIRIRLPTIIHSLASRCTLRRELIGRVIS
jgi:hypothetical protein